MDRYREYSMVEHESDERGGTRNRYGVTQHDAIGCWEIRRRSQLQRERGEFGCASESGSGALGADQADHRLQAAVHLWRASGLGRLYERLSGGDQHDQW